ncbi:glycosyltransferase family 2 protein [Bacteroides thetaiotaomicron]|nr:glycosyltransferase family 2 protein [Bacteroides thetaiotaomicron]
MPTYNQAHFIRRAILSVLEQTYKCWELIIIDDGCTDSTERYIQDFLGNSQIRYLRNEVNQGIGYSINRGLEVAKYDLIAYLPSDDYYYKDHLLIHKKEYDNDLDLFLTFTKASSKICISPSVFDNFEQKLLLRYLPEGKSPSKIKEVSLFGYGIYCSNQD